MCQRILGQKGREKRAAGSGSAPCKRGEKPFGDKLSSCSWSFSLLSVFMAFAPMGPEVSFFEVLDQHRASLLAALRRGGREPSGGGTHLASRYKGSAGAHVPGKQKARTVLGLARLWGALWGKVQVPLALSRA